VKAAAGPNEIRFRVRGQLFALKAVKKLAAAAEADSDCCTFPGTAVPGYQMPPLRGWSRTYPCVILFDEVS
jgi:hypothetical protein